jgi:hypothetical protein
MPSMTWPSRSIVIPGAPTIRPYPPQSTRSFRRRVLSISTWPHATVLAVGSGPMVQANILVSKVLAASVARTQNSWSPGSKLV